MKVLILFAFSIFLTSCGADRDNEVEKPIIPHNKQHDQNKSTDLTTSDLCDGLNQLIEFTDGPNLTPDKSTVKVKYSSTNDDVMINIINVYPWMDAHGHGASMKKSFLDISTNKAVLTNFYLIMPGLWQIKSKVEVSLNDKKAKTCLLSTDFKL